MLWIIIFIWKFWIILYKESADDVTIVGYITRPGVNGVNDETTVAMSRTYVALKKAIDSIPQLIIII